MTRRRQAEIVVSLGVLILLVCVAPVIAQQYTFTHFAGSTGDYGSADGTGASARFNQPGGVAVDASGNVYVADTYNHTIRKISSAGAVTTLAGLAGVYGSTDGDGSVARFAYPEGIAIDSGGNLYVGDYGNSAIRKITPAGVVSTLAGTLRTSGFVDGTGAAAQFNGPYGVAVDGSGNVYVADNKNNAIRRITAAGVVTTFAGGTYGTADGTGTAAQFEGPRGVAVDASGNVYVADTSNYRIRMITPGAVVTTLAAGHGIPCAGVAIDASGNLFLAIDLAGGYIAEIPSGSASSSSGDIVFAGTHDTFSDATGSAAGFSIPVAITVDGSGKLFVADVGNHNIRKITPSAVVTTFAGAPATIGSADGTGAAAQFKKPQYLTFDSTGNIVVSDYQTIRKITPTAAVTTFAGDPTSFSGGTDGTRSAATFLFPEGIGINASGTLYVGSYYTIRAITPGAVVTTLAGLAGAYGQVDAVGSDARFQSPTGVVVDSQGNIFVADMFGQTIRKVTPAGSVTTFAGNSVVPSFGSPTLVDGTGTAARFNQPAGLAIDSSDNIYVADSWNCAIRKITPAAVVTTIAGGHQGSADGTGSAAQFGLGGLSGIALDVAGNIYAADTKNQTIRKITQAGVVTTVAGSVGVTGNTDGTGAAALFNAPIGVAIDPSGAMYVADSANNTIRKGVPAIADVATIDAASGQPGTMRLLGASPNTASSWLWEEIRRPSASTATVSSTSTPNPSFTPDVAGLYVFRLTASSSAGARVSSVSLLAGIVVAGDMNGDGSVNAADVIYLINNLFAGGPATVASADVNGDGKASASDVFYFINYLFAGGPALH